MVQYVDGCMDYWHDGLCLYGQHQNTITNRIYSIIFATIAHRYMMMEHTAIRLNFHFMCLSDYITSIIMGEKSLLIYIHNKFEFAFIHSTQWPLVIHFSIIGLFIKNYKLYFTIKCHFFNCLLYTSSNIKFQFLMHLIFQCPHIIEILFFYLQFFISVQVLSPDFWLILFYT